MENPGTEIVRKSTTAAKNRGDDPASLTELFQDLYHSGFRVLRNLDHCSVSPEFLVDMGFEITDEPGDIWQVCWSESDHLSAETIEALPGGSIIITRAGCDIRFCAGIREYPVITSPKTLRIYVKPRRIDVVIPVYNAIQETLSCLRSLKDFDDPDPLLDVNYLFIDDASPDSAVLPKLRASLPYGWHLLINQKNLGFPGTVNRGLTNDKSADVVMVNSDVCVTRGWLRRMAQTAGEGNDIATVTAMAQEASMYSWPPYENMPIDYKEAADAFLDSPDIGAYEIPVGVGFCMYVKRSVINKIGILDLIFGRGYGEDTDFCLRAREAGYRNLMEPRVYIFHSGGASMTEVFGDRRVGKTVPEKEALVHQRWPDYSNLVRQFFDTRCGPEAAHLDRVFLKYTLQTRRRILIISHKPIGIGHLGGVELHARETIDDLREDYVFVAIAPNSGSWHARIFVNGIVHRFEPGDLNSRTRLDRFLDDIQPDLIHVQHPLGIPKGFITAVNARRIPIVLSVHDYSLVCPKYNLVGPDGFYCGLEPLAASVHNRCLKERGLNHDLGHWRSKSQEILDSVTKIIFVSKDVYQRHRSIFRLPEIEIIPCGIAQEQYHSPAAGNLNEEWTAPDVPQGSRLHLCILGAGRPDKGRAIISKAAKLLLENGVTLSFLGSDQTHFPEIPPGPGVRFLGAYPSEKIVARLQALNPDVVCLPSPWPETFSRTLSESWKAGIPAIVSPLGAPADRVRENDGGWILEEYSPESLVRLLNRLAGNPEEVRMKRVRTAQIKIPTSKDASAAISKLYTDIVKEPKRLEDSPRLPFDFSVQPVAHRKRVVVPPHMPSYMLYKVFPNTQLGAFGKFLATIVLRIHEVGYWRTLGRPISKLILRLTPTKEKKAFPWT